MNPMTTGRIASVAVFVCLLLASAAAAQTVQTNTLESLRSIFNSATTRISADTQRQRNEALVQYGKTLEGALKALKEKGDIETYAGVEEAYKRFKSDKAVMTNAGETLVFNAVVAYQKQLACVESNSMQRTASVLKQYVAALNGLVKDLMARDKIEDAKAAGEVRRYAELYLAELLSRLQPDEPRGEKATPEAGGPPPSALPAGLEAKSPKAKPAVPVGTVEIPSAGVGRLPLALRTGLVLYYSFDKDEGDHVSDLSGKGHRAAVHGAKWIADGPCGGGMSFDGKSAYIESGDAGLPLGDAPRSIAFWFRLRKGGARSSAEILGYGTETANHLSVLGMDWRLGRDSVSFTQCGGVFVSATKMKFGQWYHVVYVYGGNGAHRFYIDGRESSGLNELGSIDTVAAGKFVVGSTGTGRYFNGCIDEVMMYDRALTEAEAKQVHAYGR